MTLGTGIHLNIPSATYHADPCIVPSLSSSVAQMLLRASPYKAWFSHPRLNSGYVEEQDDKFDLGTAAHAMLLENGESSLVSVNAPDWRTKMAQEAKAAARAAGKTAVLSRQMDKVREMVTAARAFLDSSEVAAEWKAADSEVTAIGQEQGIWLRARFDRLPKSHRSIFDYKTTTDASPDQFERQIVRMGYHLQDAFYRRVALLCKLPVQRFVFLAQSVEPPYECSLHGCDQALCEIADAEVDRSVRLWRDCIKENKWPSYSGRIHWAIPTTWQIRDHEERLMEAA